MLMHAAFFAFNAKVVNGTRVRNLFKEDLRREIKPGAGTSNLALICLRPCMSLATLTLIDPSFI